MHTKSRPKQFLELNGKPIIIYTIELFDNHYTLFLCLIFNDTFQAEDAFYGTN